MNAIDDTSALLGADRTASDEQPTLLAVILDTNPTAWEELKDRLTLKQAVQSMLVFINAHLSLRHSNRVVVLAAHDTCAKFLYPTNRSDAPEQPDSPILQRQTMYRPFREVNEAVIQQIDLLLEQDVEAAKAAEDKEASNGHGRPAGRQTAISGALSLALAYINKLCGDSDSTDPNNATQAAPVGAGTNGTSVAVSQQMSAKILLLSVSGDLASQYIPTMNCIFAAQKKRIPIDVCKINGDTVFLQQACDSTNGTYMKIEHPQGLVQYLLSAFMVEPSLRSNVYLSTQKDVDFRAACFITRDIIDIGYVCSVCLCIMSILPSDEQCPMCGTKYDTHAMAKFKRKPVVVAKKKSKKRKLKPDSTPTPGP